MPHTVCPHCGKLLGPGSFTPSEESHCPSCRGFLRPEGMPPAGASTVDDPHRTGPLPLEAPAADGARGPTRDRPVSLADGAGL